VDILEHQDKGRAEALDEVGDCLKEAESVIARRGKAGPMELGQEPGEFCSPDRAESVEQYLIVDNLPASEGVDPGAERQDRCALVRAPDQDAHASGDSLGGECTQQPGLANSGLPDYGDESPVTDRNVVQSPA
jgi:hypothetical protein